MATSQNTTPNDAIDHEAFLEAAAERKFGTHDNQVWGKDGLGRLYTVKAPEGFAHIAKAQRPFLAMMYMQGLEYRIAQNVDGKSVQAAVDAVCRGNDLPSAKENDAWETVYTNYIADLVENQLGALPDKPTKEQVAERRDIINASAAKKANRDKYFQAAVDAAIAAGKSAVPARERKRQTKAGGDKGLSL